MMTMVSLTPFLTLW